ncbi:MAG: DNA polymerase I [Christensenellales bacterium]
MTRLILLDSNSLINRAYYALPYLSNKAGQPTGGIFGYLNMLFKIKEQYNPTHIIAVFDQKAPTFRKAMYEDYKANRKGMPDDLARQIQPMKDLLAAMNIPVVALDGYEADDIIGTFAKRFDVPTFIVTGDRDSLQLIDDTTTVLLTKKGISEIAYYDEKALAEEGLRPSQIIDLKSLMGDSSDNIPGVAGVGEKTAKDLLARYDTLDGVYNNIGEIKGKLQEKLINGKDMAYLSYRLATINTDTPVAFELDDAKVRPCKEEAREIFRNLEFFKLLPKLDGDEIVQEKKAAIDTHTINVSDAQQLGEIVDEIKKNKVMSLYLGQQVSLACNQEKAYVIQVCDNLLGEGVDFDEFLQTIKPMLESEQISKKVFDAKSMMHTLADKDIALSNYDDVLLKAYLCNAIKNYKDFDELRNAYLADKNVECADIFALDNILDDELKEKGLVKLYEEVELPLVRVLFDMEEHGFRVDRSVLDLLNVKFGEEIDDLSEEIIELAGKPFNINSTKQLASVLFEDLKLKGGKKTKTGYSTNSEVLEGLKNSHPIIPLVLRYRELTKLKSTYLDGLLPLIDGRGYVHTVFKQTVTATGRLSSTEPNLQNIPVRRPEGKQIRKMYIAGENNKLVCADYSQIELRLMAHLSGDQTMIDAFNSGVDIHATTAAQVMGVPLDKVDSDMRRQAKAVNFGIIYGISDYGLSNDLSIPVWKARDFINTYFEKYPKVKKYTEDCVAIASRDGYICTMYGRRRDIPEISSSNYNIRSFGERIAMNMPLQGSASDIIKIAMLKVYDALKKENLKAKLIMQVHDELIVDTPSDEVERVKKIMKECMESVCNLKVKLEAEVGVGDNWLEAK